MSWLRRFFGDLDTTFSYASTRKLVIRDFRLGLFGLLLQVAIFSYIVYEIIFLQVYRRDSSLSISLRTSVRQEAVQCASFSVLFCFATRGAPTNTPAPQPSRPLD
jgi:hypothetical protein